jgi:hypothetical protein
MKIIDLDILKPEAKIIRLGGNDIDVSFLPSGITFEIDALMKKLYALSSSDEKIKILAEGGAEAEEAYKIAVEICGCFCARKFPEMNADWFKENCNSAQITAFAQAIQGALTQAYNTGDTKTKNAVTTKRKK